MKASHREIFAIAGPAIVSNITVPVLGLVDTAIAGHLGTAAFIGAIAVGSTVFSMMYWLFGFLRMSTAGLTAQCFGASDHGGADRVLVLSTALALCFGLLIIVLSPWAGNGAISFMDAGDNVTPFALRYFGIVVWGAPAVLGMYSATGWLIGMQDTRLPMMVSVLTNVVNIALSATFVFGFGMKIEGIALGTVLSQWTGYAVCMIAMRRRYRPSLPSLSVIMDRHAFAGLFSINFFLFLRTLLLVAVTVWFTRAGAGQGVVVLSANALLMQLFLFFSYFSDGFAYAGEALAGKAHGAGDRAALCAVAESLTRIGFAVALVFSVIYFVAGDLILQQLTDRGDVLDAASEYLPWAVAVPLCGVSGFVYDGIFVGLTRPVAMLLSIGAGAVVFFAIYFLAFPVLGNDGLWLAFVAYLAVRGVILHFVFRSKFSGGEGLRC